MAPKKKHQQKHKPSSSSQSSSSSGPKLQISAENETRLRRLLLNSGRSTPSPADDSLSKAQKAKKLRTVYEKLSCEGFTDQQIELALSALKENATFEAALDWLCLNLDGNELPSKFSSGTSLHANEGSVGILSIAQEDWKPSVESSLVTEDEMSKVSIQVKARQETDTLDSLQPSQADWIRQYVQQQEEDEFDTWEAEEMNKVSADQVLKSRSDPDSIVKEYHDARLEALNAKQRGDRKGQEDAGKIIRKLKQEISALGLSDDLLSSVYETTYNHGSEQTSDLPPCEHLNDNNPSNAEDVVESKVENVDESCSPKDISEESVSTDKGAVEDESGDIELGNLLFEDSLPNEVIPSEVMKLQKKEKIRELSSGKNLEKLEGIWKKGDPQKIPKAILQQFCQKLGWEPPKYNKLPGKGQGPKYSVNVLRKASGRGKSRKAGGLVSFQLPTENDTFKTAEDAQNAVAAFALFSLFPDLPIHVTITEPYASFVLEWIEGESSEIVDDKAADRRAGFVDSLLNIDITDAVPPAEHMNSPLKEMQQKPEEGNGNSVSVTADPKSRRFNQIEAESSYLTQKQENKKKTDKYKVMLESRAKLPIAELKDDILRLLKENNVLVVCGETGCGKTTQVPQFILDDVIEAGRGGHCNIICTQPRRIAAISVAERVADERCESSPGSNDSLVGYQVRLDSARNERTKLLFCTTGILLRKFAGDKDMSDLTHVIVDEVHERSLLGDFLLIVLKKLIEKQSKDRVHKLKVILMSATVDSEMFSRYFGNCPVITAEGRTHPVSTCFLEDIYESLNYRLSSDSPASIRNDTSKQRGAPVTNHRGKKNLVLSGWGDESLLYEDSINPYYEPTYYGNYSEQTRQNLKRLNEDVIDYDLLEDMVCHIDETSPEGAILVFLPGVSEIHLLYDKLAASYRFRGPSTEWLLPLHSSIASADQRKVFSRPPSNIRKVIIATNIAETSITIDDVVYVVDCGKHKENRYNPQQKLTSMVEDWISQANARQRRGRAGRVKPGSCFCMYTRHRYDHLMRPFQQPEMLRMPLVELCLQIKLLSLGNIRLFLSEALEPPKEDAITSAISLLYEVGALEGDEELTPLGYHLAKLPVDVLIGKMMLYGGIFGCLSPILSISAFLSYKSPFVYPKDERQTVERAKLALLTDKSGVASDSVNNNKQSDHLVMMVAYRKWEKILRESGGKAAQRFCSSYFLSSSVMYMIRDMRIQFGTLLADIGLVNLPKTYQINGTRKDVLDSWFSDMSEPFNINSNHFSVVRAILCAGLYPNVAAMEEGIAGTVLGNLKHSVASPHGRPVWYDGKREVHIHPSSINSNSKGLQYPFLVFLEKVETNRVFLRDTTIISPYSILLFGGSINLQHQTGLVIIDGWLKLKAPAQTAVLFKELRATLHSILKELIGKPQTRAIADNEVMRSIIHLLLEEDKPLK
ncbi:DExH-box ATP-dependent RNA helicase DExH7, chloroplastic isoform X2 [Daucus carota subsp. sativus]|uniref:DExH-box ATP-dependent RNA helicase DExH7, chloroplastic isoform X2 n=1 Tax=Daucus carota subsp. sativus TaxID=79200 RepID=UPI0007EF8CB8|nr:PREDICTED: DExH-box ATP-dependent RNA helicase DExH7, chloroplastic-like isoform X2 [Daucus carota subsp. sativus]